MKATNEPKLFFLTGVPKSGTTWMMNMLNCIQGVRCRGEGRFFSSTIATVPSLYQGVMNGIEPWHEYISHRKKNWLGLDKNIQTINRKNFIPQAILQEELQEDTRQIIQLAIRYFMIKKGENSYKYKWIGDKTPLLAAEEFRIMTKIFPKTKIIFLQRNVKDFIVSVLFHYWRSIRDCRPDRKINFLEIEDFLTIEEYMNSAEHTSLPFVRINTAIALAKRWKIIDNEVQKYKKNGQIKLFHYEEFFEHPHDVLQDVVDFLEITINSRQLSEIVKQNTRSEIKHSGNEALKNHIRSEQCSEWSKYLNDEVVSVINSVCN